MPHLEVDANLDLYPRLLPIESVEAVVKPSRATKAMSEDEKQSFRP